MIPHEFVAKWRGVELKERSASQSHFNDLCALLGVLDPVSADPTGEWFAFEKGASKTGGGEGWADVWRKGHFAWEYKGKRKDLKAAFNQLLQYAVALENPPLLIVSDMDRIRIHTNWTNTVQEVHEFTLEELVDGHVRDRLKQAFIDPEALKPAKTRQELTEETAGEFAELAQRLRDRGFEAHKVAHFVNQLVFCMFAEDVGLLRDHLFTKMLEASRGNPAEFVDNAQKLFGAMATGGKIDFARIDWFNGGLFENDHVLPVGVDDIEDLYKAAKRHWDQIDPSILGTLFERGLDPAKRSQLGAHYTDREKIMMIVRPVIIEPLEAEWAEALAKMTALVEKAPKATKDKLLRGAELAKRTRALAEAEAIHNGFIERLAKFRVLDPACGSGNFLYVALRALKDIEHRANLDAEALGLPRGFPRVGPECVLGIELNPYAAELARVSVWIGEIQWMRRNGFEASKNPILRSLETIECRDAVLNKDGTRAKWPNADVIIGNPPFVASRDMINELEEEYTNKIRRLYAAQVTSSSDFVAYWFAKALSCLASQTKRVGLVATDSLPRGDSRFVLDRVVESTSIFHAVRSILWNDRADSTSRKTAESAQVRVCMICFGSSSQTPVLDGRPVDAIESDLSGTVQGGFVRRHVNRLRENLLVANQGVIPRANVNEKDRTRLELPKASFLLSPSEASAMCKAPVNPNGQPNSRVIKPYVTGEEILEGRGNRYLIDFTGLTEAEASLYEMPFDFLHGVKAHRAAMKQEEALAKWWLPWNNRDALRKAIMRDAYIATPRNSKQRIFVRVAKSVIPDCEVVAVTRSDFTTFGVLNSQFHTVWTLNTCSFYGVANTPRYSHKATFETFPFPEGLTPDIPAADYADDPRAQAIAAAAARLNELRENWLNPADLVVREPEVMPGYPDRILPKDGEAAKELKKRTLTNLYNARPQWLANAHAALDEAVAEAYGWSDDWRGGVLTDDEILARLFRLNQERSAA